MTRPLLLVLVLALILPALTPAHPPVEVPLAEVEARIAAAPEDPGLRVRRGELLHRAGRLPEAEAEFTLAARLRPDDPTATLAHAALLLAQDRPAEAETRLLAVPSDDPEWWMLLSRARAERDPVAAREALERAWSRLDPLRPEDVLFRMRLVLAADPAAVDEALGVLDEGQARLGPAAALAIEAAGLEIAAGRNEAAIHRLDTWSTPVAALASPPAIAAGATWVPAGATWDYEDTGTDLGTAWRDPGTPAGTWSAGPAPLGYGETYIATTVSYGGNSSNKNPTTYFRTGFHLVSVPVTGGLLLDVRYDDSFVAYLNGIEVARSNVSGAPAYGTYADGNHEATGFETFPLGDVLGLLVAGDNVLAVEVHQVGATSSDLVLDASLTLVDTATLVRGPYLQVAGDDAVTVRWRTDLATASRVGVGTTAGSFPRLVDDGAAVTEHEVRVPDLDPDTRYHYFVGSPTETLAVGPTETFRTHPLPGDEGPRRIWVIGDAGTANANQAAVRDGFLAWNGGAEIHGWLMLGDNAYSTGTDVEYQAAVFDMYPDQLASIPLWATRGNHDDLHAGPGNDYYDLFTFPTAGESGGVASGTEAYYSFDLGNVHFVCLDSDGSIKTPGSAMLTWLAADLAANTQDWTVAFWHHPPYTKGSHDSDDPGDSGGYLVAMRENVLPVLEAGGVDLVLGGHSHSYERSYLLDEHYGFSPSLVDSMILDDRTGDPTIDGAYLKPTLGPAPHEGAVYVVAGSSGQVGGGSYDHPAMVASLPQLASLVLDVEGNRLRGTMVGTTGNAGDTFVVLKGVEPTAAPEGPGPAGLSVSPARPNPFTHRTRLAFRVPDRAPVRVTVHDVTGRERARLVDAVLPAGDHEVDFEGRDTEGRPLPRGVYFVRFAVGNDVRPMKLVLR